MPNPGTDSNVYSIGRPPSPRLSQFSLQPAQLPPHPQPQPPLFRLFTEARTARQKTAAIRMMSRMSNTFIS